METKKCSKCGVIKELVKFPKSRRDGYVASCKACHAVYARKYVKKNPEVIRLAIIKYHLNNKEKVRLRNRQWRRDNPDKEVAAQRNWYKNNKSKLLVKMKCNRKNDISLRLYDCVYIGVYRTLNGKMNNQNIWEMVGFTCCDLIKHIESQFENGMTWDNYGKWHIDHIIPKSFFQFIVSGDVEFRMCWRLENLQPLWARENYRKRIVDNIMKALSA